jgi:hypothetical protein
MVITFRPQIVMDKKQVLAQVREHLQYFGYPEIANLPDEKLEGALSHLNEVLASQLFEQRKLLKLAA